MYKSTNKNDDNIFVTDSMDAQSHFESVTETVLDMYKEITGNELDLVNLPEENEEVY